MAESRRPRGLVVLLLAALSGHLFLTSLSASPSAEGGELLLGPLVAQAPDGWESRDSHEVEWLLSQEGNLNQREFALSGPGDAVIYATHGEYPDFTITAQAILSMAIPPTLTNQWGISPDKIRTELRVLDGGLEAASMIASGSGSGLDFLTRKDVPTVAVWVDVPAVFGDGVSIKSGVSTIFFRGTRSAAEEGALKQFEELLSSLRLQDGYRLASIQEFEAQSVPDAPAVDTRVAVVPKPAPVTVPQPARPIAPDKVAKGFVDPEEPITAARIGELEALASVLPANPYLREELEELKPQLAEREWVRQHLAQDPDGSKASSLRALHENYLLRARENSGTEGVDEYLHYLSRVWPGNPLGTPPTENVKQGVKWLHPYLGVEFVRVEPTGGRPFWISREPVLETLRRGGAADRKLPDSPTFKDAVDLAVEFSASIPTRAEYEAYARAFGESIYMPYPLWAERPAGDRKELAVEFGSSSLTLLRKRPGVRLRNGDFLLVLRPL